MNTQSAPKSSTNGANGTKSNTSSTKSNTQISLLNQSRIYEAFGEDEKLTINEVVDRVNENIEPHRQLSNRTVRRAIEGLVKNGFIKPHGKSDKAVLYGRISASFGTADDKLINFGGQLVSIEDFLVMVVDMDSKPLQRTKMKVLSSEMEHQVRRRLAFVVLSAGNAGLHDQVMKVQRELFNVLAELEYASNIVQAFMDSPVWFEQYRDKIAYGMRRVQEHNPDLYQLTTEYVKGG